MNKYKVSINVGGRTVIVTIEAESHKHAKKLGEERGTVLSTEVCK